jgi:hypothetical protein
MAFAKGHRKYSVGKRDKTTTLLRDAIIAAGVGLGGKDRMVV